MTLFGGPMINKLGIKKSCVIAAIAMPLAGLSYYSNAQYGITWFLLTAQFIGGFTSGFLYVAEATAMLSYPMQDERGFYLGIWSAMRNSGSIFGGAINFAKNYDNSKAGGIVPSTYLLFVTLEFTGLIWALNLTPTHLVQRSNGTKISTLSSTTWRHELNTLHYHLRQKKTWLLSVPAFYSFYHGGTLSSYLSLHFTIRSRALSSFISPLLAVPSVIAYGRLLLDLKQFSQRKRAKIAALFWVVPQMVCLLWISFEYSKFDGGFPILDYNLNLRKWIEAYLPSLLMFITGCFTQLSLYWIIGTLSNTMSTNSQLGGLFRAFETAGMAVSYAMNSSSEQGVRKSFHLNIFLLILTIPCMVKIIQLVPNCSLSDINPSDEERCFIDDRVDNYSNSLEEPEAELA